MRDYAAILDNLCQGYGIDKSGILRQWKAGGSFAKNYHKQLSIKLWAAMAAVSRIDRTWGKFLCY